jgi:hypothetical protein
MTSPVDTSPEPEQVVTVPDDEDSEEVETVIDPVINPPPVRGENFRDWILSTLDRPFFQYLGLFVLFNVIWTGALFFFFLMGWQNVCRPRTDCEPRNWWYNWAIQALNVCFTYMVTVSMPWRTTNAIHTFGWSCPHRRNDPGHDLYGLPTHDIWFHLPLFRRGGILIVLLLNCIFQYINQGTRIKYYNYELQDASPGNIWTNVFFVGSFACAGIGGGWLLYEMGRVRKAHPPNTFAPGPLDMAKNYIAAYKASRAEAKKKDDDHASADDEQMAEDEEQVVEDEGGVAVTEDETDPSMHYPDPTRDGKRRSVVNVNRSPMRLFGM